MERVLIVVDMQVDFVSGALGTKEAEAIVSRVAEKVRTFEGRVIFTRDTHTEAYPDTQEGRCLPVAHCVRGTEGWQLVPDLRGLAEGREVFESPPLARWRWRGRSRPRRLRSVRSSSSACVPTFAWSPTRCC